MTSGKNHRTAIVPPTIMQADDLITEGLPVPPAPAPTEYSGVNTQSPVDSGAFSSAPAGLSSRFTAIRLVGKGGAGEVYAAFDQDLGRTVAIKGLHHARSGEQQALAQQEARAIAALHHTNIVTLFDWIPGPDVTWLVMEYVDGPSLAELIRANGPFSPEQTVQLICQVCRALHYAHQKGVWHLDIKPANIVVDAEGNPKIADFGIACPAQTDPGHGWGTPGFAPPEQLAGAPVVQSDVYAVAALAIAMLTGDQLPVGRTGAIATAAWRKVPAALRPALRASLSTRPAARPGGPGVLADWLQKSWNNRSRRSALLIGRAWDAALVGAAAGLIAAVISGAGPLPVLTRSAATWGAVLVALLAAFRPTLALLAITGVFTAALCRLVPTLGLTAILLWPLCALWARLSPRSQAISLLAPIAYSLGFPALPSILAGALLTPAGAASTAAIAMFGYAGVGHVLTLPLVQEYLLSSAPTGIVAALLRISPVDLLWIILPAAWQGLAAPTALWGAGLGAVLAGAIAWLRDQCEPPMMICITGVLLTIHALVTLTLFGNYNVFNLILSFGLAALALFASPTKVGETWEYLQAWWADWSQSDL